MKTTILKINPRRINRGKIKQAAIIIQKGGLVAFPTETVYGLGADALNPKAVRKIYKAKGRPQDNPMIVHVASIDQAKNLTKRFPPKAELLAKRYWPGPLTIILPKADKVPVEVTSGLDTVAIRMPSHSIALDLIKEAKTPIAAPSANRSGRPSPTSTEHVKTDLDGRIDMIIEGGNAKIGVESTVLDLTGKTPTILRPGKVTIEQLRKTLGNVKVYEPKKKEKSPRSPGMKYRHYAPKAPLILIEGAKKEVTAKAKQLAQEYRNKGKNVRILHTSTKTHAQSAADLYKHLRQCDKEGINIIIAEATDEKNLGHALMNRLRKAATKTIKS
jgi:L-threonylcarbamoyladenylate synthase